MYIGNFASVSMWGCTAQIQVGPLNGPGAGQHASPGRGIGRMHVDARRDKAMQSNFPFEPEDHVVTCTKVVVAQVVVQLISVT